MLDDLAILYVSKFSECEKNTHTLVADDRSSHWKALLIFANTNIPSAGCSCNRFAKCSCTMTREIKDELLFAMLFLGFLLFAASLPPGGSSIEFPSPKAGADVWEESGAFALPLIDVAAPPSLATSTDSRPSLGCSCILACTPDRPLVAVLILYRSGAEGRELSDSRESFVPAVAGWGVVARGFGLIIGASDG